MIKVKSVTYFDLLLQITVDSIFMAMANKSERIASMDMDIMVCAFFIFVAQQTKRANMDALWLNVYVSVFY